ncbi:JAB domain-containing protein, partial [Enterococcus faecium]|nr:JAB domain-containing protein [Enterococcus faecium]
LKIEQKYISEDRSFYRVTSSVGLANFATNLIGNNASESLLVMCLNTKNEVIAYSEVFKGGINQSVAIPREIFQLALLNNSAKIAVSHNHPSGYEFPSENDKSFTTNLKNAGKTIGIELLDHIIVTSKNTSYYSFQENGSL